jgi:LPS O-antigen subunit length determinant protein (WzzB/FepE family)
LLESRTLAAPVIARFKLDAPPYALSPAEFATNRLSVAQIRDTSYLRITLRMPSAALAADALNAFLQESIELNRRLSVENATSVAQGLMKTQLDQARSNVDGRTKQVESARTAARLEIIRKDVEQVTELRRFIRELDGAIQAERARVAMAEGQLASRPRTLSVPRISGAEGPLLEYTRRITDEGASGRLPQADSVGPSSAPVQPAETPVKSGSTPPTLPPAQPRVLTEGSITAGAGGVALPLPLQTDAFIDPVHEILEYQVAMGRTRLAALQAQRAELMKREGDPVSELYAGEARVTRFELDHELATQVYKDLSLRYEQAREYAVSHAAIIQVADPATPPTHPVSPNRPLAMAGAAVIGLMLGFLIVVIRQLHPLQHAVHRPRI